jgi:type I restriction enzyme, S subunit
MLTHRTRTILGETPSDWGRELLKNLLSDQKGGDWGDDSGEVPIHVLRSTNFTDRGLLNFGDVALRYFGSNKGQTLELREKDILLERSGGSPTQPVGRVGFITQNLPAYWFSNFVQLLRPEASKIDPEFLGWLLLELNRCGLVERLQYQTTQMRNLDYRDYLRVYLPLPDPLEQETIACVLKTANELLAAAETKLLAARRVKAALLQELFVRGIPGRHTRFKQTKIGEVPEEWEVLPLGTC